MGSIIRLKKGSYLPVDIEFESENYWAAAVTSGEPTVDPVPGAIYSINNMYFTVTAWVDGTNTMYGTVSGTSPLPTGTLTKVSGTGDSSIAISSVSNSQTVNLTDTTVTLRVKRDAKDPDSEAIVEKSTTTHVNSSLGLTRLVFSSSDSANYPAEKCVWSLFITNSGINTVETDTGVFIIEEGN